MSNNRPIIYHWISQYSDGTALPQYDPYNYTINKFDDIDQSKLIKFGIYPFTSELAEGMRKNGVSCVAIPILPRIEINVDNHKRIIYYRDVFIRQETYHKCGECGKEFFAGKGIEFKSTKYSSPICPHCGAYDDMFCPKCDKSYLFEETTHDLCPKCNGILSPRKTTSSQYGREKRWTEYIIGYQFTTEGHNHKFLIRVDESGNSEVL